MNSGQVADVVIGTAVLILVVWEVYAIFNKTKGDTITERVRKYFGVKTKFGAYFFLAVLGTTGAWFAAHIVQIMV